MTVIEQIYTEQKRLERKAEYLFKKLRLLVALNQELVELLNEWLRVAGEDLDITVDGEKLMHKTVEVLKRHTKVRD